MPYGMIVKKFLLREPRKFLNRFREQPPVNRLQSKSTRAILMHYGKIMKVHNWLARLRFRDRARPEPKWPLVTRLLGEPHHVRNVQRNVNRGLLGGLVVRDPSAPCADYEIPIFVHQMQASAKGYFFRSEELRPYDEGRQTSRGAGAPQG